jgi:hypothetical protein
VSPICFARDAKDFRSLDQRQSERGYFVFMVYVSSPIGPLHHLGIDTGTAAAATDSLLRRCQRDLLEWLARLARRDADSHLSIKPLEKIE